eukprot:5596000-Prymnesium_polylepis.2
MSSHGTTSPVGTIEPAARHANGMDGTSARAAGRGVWAKEQEHNRCWRSVQWHCSPVAAGTGVVVAAPKALDHVVPAVVEQSRHLVVVSFLAPESHELVSDLGIGLRDRRAPVGRRDANCQRGNDEHNDDGLEDAPPRLGADARLARPDKFE